MRWFDPKFKENRLRYLIQSLLAAGIFSIIMYLLDILLNATVVASLAATTFIVFTLPHKDNSKPRYILGGYSVGTLVGTIFSMIAQLLPATSISLLAGLTVGLAIFLMVTLNFEHPPATAFALGLVLDGSGVYTLVIVFFSLMTMLFLKHLLRKHLIDLL